MMIKKKSLLVALLSSFVICWVLVLTLVGYLFYLEIKAGEFRHTYQELLRKANARTYSKYIEVSGLEANIQASGALKGKVVMTGVIKNASLRDITDLLLKVKFLDNDGAVIYEAVFHPQEPSLGSAMLAQIPISYLSSPQKVILKSGDQLPFKKILVNCPDEIASEIKKGRGYARGSGRWTGKFAFEILSIGVAE